MVFVIYTTFFYFFNRKSIFCGDPRHLPEALPVMNRNKMAVTRDREIYLYEVESAFESIFDSFTRVCIQVSIDISAGMRNKCVCC